MTIKRTNHGAGHKYVDVDTGARIPGVTTLIKKGAPTSRALMNWHANATIDYAVDHWDELAELSISERIKRLSRARYEVRDKARRRGSVVHKLAERLINDEKVPIPEGLEGYVEAYVKFLDEFAVKAVLTEFVVVSHEHKYCGTGDLIGDLATVEEEPDESERWLLDIKLTRSGVYGETALQLAPYRFADAWVDADGVEHEIPEVTRTGVVWVRPDGYDLVPVEAGQRQFYQFLYAMQMAEFADESRDLVGDPVDPQRRSTFRLEQS